MVNITIKINGTDRKNQITDAYPTLAHTENHGSVLLFTMLRTALPTLELNQEVEFMHDNAVMFLGNIMEITPRDEIIEVVAGDGMNKLKGMGANYYYTHYRTRVVNKRVSDGVANNRLYLNVKSGISIDANPPPLYAVNNDAYDVTLNQGDTFPYACLMGYNVDKPHIWLYQRFKIGNRFLYGIQVRVHRFQSGIKLRFALCNSNGNNPGSEIFNMVVTTSTVSDSYISFNFPAPIEIDSSKSYWFKIDDVDEPPNRSTYLEIALKKNRGLPTNDNYVKANTGFMTGSPHNPFQGIEVNDSEASVPFRVLTADYRVIEDGTMEGSRFYINRIEGMSSLPVSMRNPVFDRGVVTYYDGNISIESVLKKSLDAHELTLADGSGSTNGILKYKCRGSYLATYVQDLTSMHEDGGGWDGYQTLLASSLTDTNKFYLSKRTNTNDNADLTLVWGEDEIISFNPTKTLTNRPSIQYIRSEVKDHGTGEPPVIMVSAVDMSSPILTSEATIDSGFIFASDAFIQAYGILDKTSRNVWEGTIILPGIVDVFNMVEGSDTFGSGKIIKMEHSDYGINEKLKVKKAVWSFNNYTTTITFTNVPDLTNPRIMNLDKDRIQSQSTALSFGEHEGYLCLIRTAKTPITNHNTTIRMAIMSASAVLAEVNCQVVKAERYNTVTYHAYFPPGTGTIVAEHGVQRIRLGSTVYQLRESQYQDKYAEQGLTIDIVHKLN